MFESGHFLKKALITFQIFNSQLFPKPPHALWIPDTLITISTTVKPRLKPVFCRCHCPQSCAPVPPGESPMSLLSRSLEPFFVSLCWWLLPCCSLPDICWPFNSIELFLWVSDENAFLDGFKRIILWTEINDTTTSTWNELLVLNLPNILTHIATTNLLQYELYF